MYIRCACVARIRWAPDQLLLTGHNHHTHPHSPSLVVLAAPTGTRTRRARLQRDGIGANGTFKPLPVIVNPCAHATPPGTTPPSPLVPRAVCVSCGFAGCSPAAPGFEWSHVTTTGPRHPQGCTRAVQPVPQRLVSVLERWVACVVACVTSSTAAYPGADRIPRTRSSRGRCCGVTDQEASVVAVAHSHSWTVLPSLPPWRRA